MSRASKPSIAPAPVVGQFRLTGVLGAGGMARVWRGEHLRTGAPVAVKIVHGIDEPERRRWMQRHFLSEVHAVSRIRHPHVVRIFDLGRTPATAESDSRGQIANDAPYAVMELVPGGALTLSVARPWPEIRTTLLCLLDALANAHAHGWVHRDIKPRNILLGAHGPILTDFGIAQRVEAEWEPDAGIGADAFYGTPNYMAPEQVLNDTRNFGPWTDLYSLGCLAYALVVGRPPYVNTDLGVVLHEHLRGGFPEWAPRVPVPEALRDWIRRTMAKPPSVRFPLAADAALALLRIDDAPARRTFARLSTLSAHVGADPTLVEPPTFVPVSDSQWLTSERGVAIDAPAVPETWRPPREVEHQLPVRDIGGGLAPVGAPAFLGRESERDAVWRALRGASTGGLRLCFVEGAAGVGKSAFVEWVTRRAHALGVARPLRITHERVRTPECGVAAMLRRTLRAGGLSGEALRAHLRPRLLELDVESDLEALCAWLEPDAETDTTASSRIAALARWIAARAVERPVCLVADDVDRSAETQRALVHLARTQPEAPILVLAVRTADGSAGGHRGTDTALDFVPGDRISLGPLEGGTLADVFGSALPLEEAALSALVAAADGNPWLGRMLYLHWLEEGRLHPTAEGYALAETGRPTLPTQVRSLWSERLRWACDGDPAQLACLELAATLGHEVDHVEWTRLCWSAGLEPSSATTCRLIEGDLIDIGRDERWRFAHPVVRSALRQQARDGGRAATWHGLVADALLGRSVIDSAEIGRHLLDAERPSEAAPHLARACRRALRWDEYAEARRAALSWARALRRARVPRGDEAWDRVALAWSESLRAEGEAERATRHAARAVRRAERRPVSRLLVEALQACALGRKWDLSHREQTLALARRAEAAATRLGADSLRARSAARLGVLLHTYGELADAEAAFRRAKSAGAATDSRRLRAEISLGLARVLIEHSDVVTAAVELEGALALARDAKAASLVAEVLTTLGDVARSRGAFDEAERRYSAALVVFEDTGAFASGWAGWANLALLALDRNQPAAAAPPLQRAREIALSIRNAAAMDMLASVGLSLAAADGAWAQFDATLSDLLGRTDHRYAQLDSARALFALERELAATDPLRAGGVAALRRAQQQALGLADSALGVPEVSNGR